MHLSICHDQVSCLVNSMASPPQSFATLKIFMEAGDESWYITLSKLTGEMGAQVFEAPGSHIPSNTEPGGSISLWCELCKPVCMYIYWISLVPRRAWLCITLTRAAVCNPSCQNGGTCTTPNTCNCPPTWDGSYCQIRKLIFMHTLIDPPCMIPAWCVSASQYM